MTEMVDFLETVGPTYYCLPLAMAESSRNSPNFKEKAPSGFLPVAPLPISQECSPSLRERATNLLQILGKCFNVSTTASIFRTYREGGGGGHRHR